MAMAAWKSDQAADLWTVQLSQGGWEEAAVGVVGREMAAVSLVTAAVARAVVADR